MSNRVTLNRTNMEFLAANIQKKRQAQCIRIQYDSQDTCVLSLEDIKKRT